MNPHKTSSISTTSGGFSLVELSIVLVILGLLTGGILAGRSLIRAAELQSVHREFTQWQTAAHSFSIQYLSLPGDMDNADTFWSGTANGDGDGKVTTNFSPATREEMFLFWQHLALSGHIPGQFSGTAGSESDTHHVLGENAPKSKVGNAGWTALNLYRVGYSPSSTVHYALDFGNALILGTAMPSHTTEGPIFSPEEAWSIDKKIDDGKPGQGQVIASSWDNDCVDADSNTDFDSNYVLIDSATICGLVFRQAF